MGDRLIETSEVNVDGNSAEAAPPAIIDFARPGGNRVMCRTQGAKAKRGDI